MNKLVIGIATIFLVSILLVGIFYFQPSFLNPNTIISTSQIYVDQQGKDVGGQWTDSFWNIVASLQLTDDIAGVILPKGQTTQITVDQVQESLKTGAKIEIKIDAGQPYLERNIVQKTSQVCKVATKTYKDWLGQVQEDANAQVSDFWVNYWDWAEPSFRIYTPFTVYVYKDGALVGQQQFSSITNDASIKTVPTNEGAVWIENLGTLQGQYMTPNTPASIALIGGDAIYDYNAIRSSITMSVGSSSTPWVTGGSDYSKYWYGNYLWTNNQHHAAVVAPNTLLLTFDSYGGWKSGGPGDGNSRYPIRPVTFVADKSTSLFDDDARSKMSLVEFLNSKTTNYANTLFNQYSKVEFVSTGGQTGNLRLYVPWAAYGTPVIVIRFPTELADTIVERRMISHVTPTAYWERTGTDHAEISSNQRLMVDLKQESSVRSGTYVKIFCDNAKVGLYPLEYREILDPQQSKTVSFQVTNLGVETKQENIPIDVVCYEDYMMSETGRSRVYVTLLPTLAHNTTQLTIYAVEATNHTSTGAKKPISGLQVQILYPPSGTAEQKQGFTASDGSIPFSLDMAGGGGYTGEVLVKSVDTSEYKAASTTVSVTAGPNEVTLEVIKKGDVITDQNNLWLYLAIGAVVAIIIVVAAYALKKKKRRRR